MPAPPRRSNGRAGRAAGLANARKGHGTVTGGVLTKDMPTGVTMVPPNKVTGGTVKDGTPR